MNKAHQECERYAGNLEQALEDIREHCHQALALEEEAGKEGLTQTALRACLSAIEGRCQVKDDRSTLDERDPGYYWVRVHGHAEPAVGLYGAYSWKIVLTAFASGEPITLDVLSGRLTPPA